MPLRWDALLARHTAAELARALAGHRVVGLRLDGTRRELALLLDDRALLWSLHPSRGWPRVVGSLPPSEDDLDVRGRVVAVEAPPDERLVRIALAPTGDRSATLVIELLGNQWNALVIEGEPPVIRHVLWRREGARVQRVGELYRWPRALSRTGLAGDVSLEQWLDALDPLPESEREHALVRTFAWASPLNAAALLGAAEEPGDPPDLRAGHARWHEMASGAASPAKPVLLDIEGALQPYPFPLAGTPSRGTDSLLAAFEAVAAAALGGDSGAPIFDPALLSRLEAAARRAAGRATKLEREIASLPDPALLRATGDLVLARYADIPHGAARARLTGFDGASVEVELDPADPPHANAARYYREATKAERAAQRLPALLEQARGTLARMETLVAKARAGTLAPEEARSALGGSPRAPTTARERGPTLPYRVFRSSGGLEIRVGRGARHNDDLTFRHSSPGDVWLHARHVGGAHVILRWPGPGNPPARDLAEAATLAALHSKARTSGSVPVDWTLRKYVRKPRKSPPGRVAVERVETLFVRPEPALLETLAIPQEI